MLAMLTALGCSAIHGQGHSGCASVSTTHGPAALLCMRVPVLYVMLLSPSKARLIAFKTEVPSQKDLPSHLAVQRSLATGAFTGLGKTGKKSW